MCAGSTVSVDVLTKPTQPATLHNELEFLFQANYTLLLFLDYSVFLGHKAVPPWYFVVFSNESKSKHWVLITFYKGFWVALVHLSVFEYTSLINQQEIKFYTIFAPVK